MSRNLENWVDAFVAYTDNTEPPEPYRRWVAISTISSVLQRKCCLVWGSETFYTNLYIVLVGPPAARKGTAMRTGKSLLDHLGIPVAADQSSPQKLVKSLQESGSSIEMEDSIEYHCSLTIQCSELTVFLGFQAKELLSTLCKWYDCESLFVYDTHARGKEEVSNVWVNMLGAPTPGQLQAALPEDAVGSGFTSRVLFIYEANKGKLVKKPTLNERIEEPLLYDLASIRNMSGYFEVTDGFEELYFDWYESADENKVFSDPRLDYYVQRRPTHLFKVAMVYSASRSDSMVVDELDLQKAIDTLESAEKNMEHVFAGIGANPIAGVQIRLLRVLEERETMKMSEVAGMFFSDVSNQQLGEIIASLEMMGKCSVDPINRTLTYKGAK